MTVDYSEFVRSLLKPGESIIADLTPEKADAWHAATGIAGEAGEVVDAVKKWTIYGKPLDRDNLVEELGDLEFFMEQLRQRTGITREETIAANVQKLSKRYHEGKFSNAQAQARADKACLCGSTDHSSRVVPDGLECPARVIRCEPEVGSCVPFSDPGTKAGDP